MIFTLLPDLDGNIRADLTADGAAGAGPLIVPANIEVSLPVDFLSGPDQSFRAGDGAEPASLTTFNVNFDLRHSEWQKSQSKHQNPKQLQNPNFQIPKGSRPEL